MCVVFSGHESQLKEVKQLVSKVIEDGPQSITGDVHFCETDNGPCFTTQVLMESMDIAKDKVGIAIGAN